MPRLWLRKKLKKLLPKPKLPLRLLPKPLPLKKLLLLPKKKQNKIVSIFLSERVFFDRTPSRVFFVRNSHAEHDSLHFSGSVVMLAVLCEMGDGVGWKTLSRRGAVGAGGGEGMPSWVWWAYVMEERLYCCPTRRV